MLQASAGADARAGGGAQQPGHRAGGTGTAGRSGGLLSAGHRVEAGLRRGAQQPRHGAAGDAGISRRRSPAIAAPSTWCRATPTRTTTWRWRCWPAATWRRARRNMSGVGRRRAWLAAVRGFAQPQWRGEPAEGQTLLIHAEQGVRRHHPVLPLRQAGRGKRAAGHPGGATAAGPAGPRPARGLAQVVQRGEDLPAFDLHCPMLSLPLALGTGSLGGNPA